MIDADYQLARGVLDDLVNWRRDVVAGRASRVVARVLGEDVKPSPGEIERLARELYYGGHAEALLDDALAALDRAMPRARDVAHANDIAKLRTRCVAARADIVAIAARNRRLAALRPPLALPPRTGEPARDLLHDAVAYVVRQWRTGFGEVAHISRFAATLAREVATGDVFQRALIADALCDLPAPWTDTLAPLLASELAYLHEARRCPHRGWSYYPRLDVLPPDADSLGQIVQVTQRLGPRDFAAGFEEPIHQALHVGAIGDGSFATWIVPPAGERTPLHERQAALVGTPRADIEVVANLAYALTLFDRARFAGEVAAAARWVAARQQPSGAWAATWYLGTAYGTYVCARLLAAVGGHGGTLEAARRRLFASQRSDGGWGREGEASNALDTALALLALDAIGPVEAVRPVRASALEYLAAFAPDDWPAVPFIIQELDDPRPLASRTITAAYVAKAVARCWA